jgi:hypothetical protein
MLRCTWIKRKALKVVTVSNRMWLGKMPIRQPERGRFFAGDLEALRSAARAPAVGVAAVTKIRNAARNSEPRAERLSPLTLRVYLAGGYEGKLLPSDCPKLAPLRIAASVSRRKLGDCHLASPVLRKRQEAEDINSVASEKQLSGEAVQSVHPRVSGSELCLTGSVHSLRF